MCIVPWYCYLITLKLFSYNMKRYSYNFIKKYLFRYFLFQWEKLVPITFYEDIEVLQSEAIAVLVQLK